MDFHNATVKAIQLCQVIWFVVALGLPFLLLKTMPHSHELDQLKGRSMVITYLVVFRYVALGTLPVFFIVWLITVAWLLS